MQDCYVIDNNGYIILSENSEDTGRFFGEAEGRAMQSLVDLGIFKMLTVYDYQAVCIKEEDEESTIFSSAARFLTVRNIFSLKVFSKTKTIKIDFKCAFCGIFTAIQGFENNIAMDCNRNHIITGKYEFMGIGRYK